MKKWSKWLSALLAALMLTGGCASLADTVARAPAAQVQAAPLPEQLTLADIEALGATAHTFNDRVTFVEGTCTDRSVQSMDDAEQVVDSMIGLLGGDERTQFEPWRTLTDANGNRYYVFQQMYAGTTVSGGAAKVITDGSGAMLGLVGSVEAELPDEAQAEGIAADQAEALVLSHMLETRQSPVQLVEGRTEKVILPVNRGIDMESEEEKEESRYVWAVYTDNPESAASLGSDLPYLAHYVTVGGEYLYSLPTILPGDEASTSGYNAAYVFEFMEPLDYTGTVKLQGEEREITVTLMRDARTGMVYLGNLERRIAVADCYEFLYNDGRVVLEASADNTGWDENSLLALYNYCRAWDYYREIGWIGGDGLGTPMLILKDFCNKDHKPIDNAAYAGRYYGWQVFLSSAANDFSGSLDVLAHEFTHCVTGSVMTYNAYMNDFGAINEAMSDIQGNLCEMMMGATLDTAWNLGENSSNGSLRSMSDPHEYQQPEYAWDLYYKPNVKTPTELNDRGGVHGDSSLLNNIAWRLCERGGMTLEQARAYWFAVDCTMVPGTDYAQLGELLPWVLKNQGMDGFAGALEAAIDATRIRNNVLPDTFDDDRALVTLTLPDEPGFMDGNWAMFILSVDIDSIPQRMTDISDGNGEYATAEEELKAILAEMGIDLDEPVEDGKAPHSFGELLSMLKNMDSESLTEELPGPSPEEEEQFVTGVEQLRDWYKRYLSDLIYADSGAAGQDGRTVRMVCRPGLTLPILFRLEVDSEMNVESLGLAVYTLGHWIDVGAMLEPLLAMMEEPDSAPIDFNLSWLCRIVDDDGVEAYPGENMVKLLGLVGKIRNWEWVRENLLFTIARGAIAEVPGEGLEALVTLNTDDYPSLKEILTMAEDDDVDENDDAGEDDDAGENDDAVENDDAGQQD